MSTVLDGTDLILSVGDNALGFSTGCKITTSAETGERLTKEASSGKWKEKYIKSFSEEITADGCVLRSASDDMPTYDALRALMEAAKPVTAQYSLRDGDKRTGKTAGGYKGQYLITSLDLYGQAGDDATYSIKLENYGKISRTGTGLTEAETPA